MESPDSGQHHARAAHGSGPAEGLSPRRLAVRVHDGQALDVRHFAVHERMNAIFEVKLVVVSPDPHVDFDGIVGHPASFATQNAAWAASPLRFWTGLCNQMQQVAVEERGLSTYELTIVPTLWLLTQRRNHRMFQQMSELEIVQKLLEEWGIAPSLDIRGAYKTRKYRVQYAESDFAFMSRMLEDSGISFYFAQEERESRLVLSDAPQAREARHGAIAFKDNPTGAHREHVTKLKVGQRVRPGRYTIGDHDTRLAPTLPLLASAAAPDGGIEGRLEQFHYAPGAFHFGGANGGGTPHADDRGTARTDVDEGSRLAAKRLGAKRADAKVVTFETTAGDLAPGVVFHVGEHPRSELGNAKGLLVVASQQSGKHDGVWSHACEARLASAPYHPPLSTPKPKVSGVECATVVGPGGEEIHTDEFGRVRVHFHWDRESQMNHLSSCWIPVSQSWGGAGYGGSNLPRIGQEVLVDFLGGDPDKPVITGRVYTKLQPTPYKLPDNKTQSGWKSNSTQKTGGYNEIMFEDAAGRELVNMQAEKDLHKLVKNDEQVTIGHDRQKLVKNDDAFTVGNDRTKLVQHDEDVTIGNDRTKLVKNDDNLTVGNDRTKMIQMSSREVVGQNRSRTVGVNESVTIGAQHTVSVGSDQSIAIGGSHTTSVASDHSTTIGGSQSADVAGSQSTAVGGAQSTTVALASTETVGIAKALTVGAAYEITVGAAMNTSVMGIKNETVGMARSAAVAMADTLTVGMARTTTVGLDDTTTVTGKSSVTAKDVEQTAQKTMTVTVGDKLVLKVKDVTLTIDGNVVTLESPADITIKSSSNLTLQGDKGVSISSGGDVAIVGAKILLN